MKTKNSTKYHSTESPDPWTNPEHWQRRPKETSLNLQPISSGPFGWKNPLITTEDRERTTPNTAHITVFGSAQEQ